MQCIDSDAHFIMNICSDNGYITFIEVSVIDARWCIYVKQLTISSSGLITVRRQTIIEASDFLIIVPLAT